MARGFGATAGTGATDRIHLTNFTPADDETWFMTWMASSAAALLNVGRWFQHESGAPYLIDHNNGVNFEYLRRTSGTGGQYRFPYTGATGSWHTLVLTQSGIVLPIAYIDGSSVTVTTTVAPTGTPTHTADQMTFGNRNAGDRTIKAGYIGVFAHWPRVLDADERGAIATKRYHPRLIPGWDLMVDFDRFLMSYTHGLMTQTGTPLYVDDAPADQYHSALVVKSIPAAVGGGQAPRSAIVRRRRAL